MMSLSRERVEELRQAIYAKQPVFAKVMQSFGGETLYSYVQRLFDWVELPYFTSRRTEIVSVIKRLVADRFDQTLADEVALQLTNYPLVSTTDHHSWLQDPFWLNADLLQTIGTTEVSAPEILRHTIVLSFSSISLNNKDGYPKGIMFHSEKNSTLHHIPLFPDKYKSHLVYGAPGLTLKDIHHAVENVHVLEKAGACGPRESSLLEEKILSSFSVETIFEKRGLDEQISRFNRALWKKLFVSSEEVQLPELVYVEIESVVRELLVTYHLSTHDSLLYRLLFEPHLHAQAQTAFENTRGGYNLKNKTGTYFFWGIDEHHHRCALFLENNILQNTDKSICIPWEAQAIAQALAEKKLMPGMLLSYLIIALYYGFTCFGGFCQVNDLTVIKDIWVKLLQTVGEANEAKAVESVDTKRFLGDVALIELVGKGYREPATSWDMMVHDINRSYEFYREKTMATTLEGAIEPLLPNMHQVLF